MRRGLVVMASICLLVAQACGDDDEPAADGGMDSSGGGKGGAGGKGGRGGAGGSDGAKAGSGGGKAGSGGSGALKAVTIRFKAKLGDEDLECGKVYAGLGKTKLAATPQDFRFFVEQVHLITKSGDEVPLQLDERAPFQSKDVALLDFTDRKGRCTVGGATVNTTITGKAPEGEYDGIVFVNGVPESLNHANLIEAKPPLQDASTNWGWLSGYRFIMSGLILDPVPDAETDGGRVGTGLNLVHVGSSGCTATADSFSCTRSNRNRVELKGFDPAKGTIVADLAKVFADVDLSEELECHGPGPECGPSYNALGVSMSDGSALDTQSVFRVE